MKLMIDVSAHKHILNKTVSVFRLDSTSRETKSKQSLTKITIK